MARHKKGDDVNGWLVIDKPRDIGSTQVVNLTRKWLNAKKNGHCGTLDPFATGVLPVAFGEATKLIPLVTDGPKEYEFVIKWGEATASGDTESEVCQRSAIIPSKEDILSVLPRFIGKISQVPPAYSAIKINGERAYNLVRRGEDVEIPERIVEIYALELLEELPEEQARFRVACSKGTYVRTLGQDIAKSLGTVGHLKELRRTKCGNFDLSQKILLENIKKIYGRMLDAGATTFWETEDGPYYPSGAGSLCHGWSAMPIYYLRVLLEPENPLGQAAVYPGVW